MMNQCCINKKARFFPFALAFIISSTFSVLAQIKMRIGVETGPTLDCYNIPFYGNLV